MKALVPHRFQTGDVLSDTDVNENLRAIARDVSRSQARRYTYCSVVIPLDGVVDTDTAAERTVPVPRPVFAGTSFPIDVVGMELSVFATAGATWTATVTDENSRTVVLSVATAGATVEGYDVSNVPLQISSADELLIVLAGSAANTITRGTLTLHLRADRHQQNDGTLVTYTPTLVFPQSPTAGATLDAQMTAIQSAVVDDTGANSDMRCICVMANDLGAAQIWRLPSGAGTAALSSHVYAVGTAARSVDMTSLVGAVTNTNTVNTTGTSNLVDNVSTVNGSEDDDPTDTADDVVITLTPTGGAISRVFGFLWYE